MGQALIERSQPVGWLDGVANSASATLGIGISLAPGQYGTAVLSLLLVAIYVPAFTFIAWLLGRVLQQMHLERQSHDGAWRGELAGMFNRVSHMAISRGRAGAASHQFPALREGGPHLAPPEQVERRDDDVRERL